MEINLKNDEMFINLIQSGILKVYKDGRVKNLQTGNYIGAKTKAGYIQIGFRDGCKTIHILVHRLVYIVYKYKMRPLPFIVNHKDGVKDNNYYKNLERSNDSHNRLHAFKMGLQIKQQGEQIANSKLSNKEAKEIRKTYKQGNITYQDLANKYEVHRETIAKIVRRQSYK